MFNIGGGEFLVIAVIALIVLGPTRLPDAARQVGKAMGELRRLSTGFQEELKSAMDMSDAEASARPAGAPRNVLGARPEGATFEAPTPPEPARPRRTTPLRAEPEPDAKKQAKA